MSAGKHNSKSENNIAQRLAGEVYIARIENKYQKGLITALKQSILKNK